VSGARGGSREEGWQGEPDESPAEREAARQARAVTQRAIRRLDVLEWLIFGFGAVLAALGGALVAWLLAGMASWDFRSTWIGASLLLFVVPGAIAVVKIRKEERADALRNAERREDDDG
jgi:uncharacterized membrane protein